MKNFYSPRNLILALIIVLILIAVTAAVLINSNNKQSATDYNFIAGEIKDTSVELKIKDPLTNDIKQFNGNITPGENILTFMNNLQASNPDFSFTYQDSQYGVFITGINGYNADSSKQEFWKLFINEKEAQVGINDYTLQSNDKLRWEIDHF